MKNLFLAAAGLLLASCAEPELVAPQNPEPEQLGEPITITVGMPSNDTKINVQDGEKALNLTWEENDQLVIVGFDESGKKCLGKSEFTLLSGAGEKNATFTGKTIPDAVKYKVYYKTPNMTLDDKGRGTMSYQNMVSDGQLSSIRPFLFLSSKNVDFVPNTSLNFSLELQNSVLCVTLPDKKVISDVNSIDWIANAGTVNEKILKLSITKPSENAKYYFCFDPQEMSLRKNSDIVFKIHGNSDSVGVSTLTDGLSYTAGWCYDAVLSDLGLFQPADETDLLFNVSFDRDLPATIQYEGSTDSWINSSSIQPYAYFNHPYAGKDILNGAYYAKEQPITGNASYKDGYSLEAYVMCGQTPVGGEAKFFSSTANGGTALMLKNGKFAFLTCGAAKSETNKKVWRWAQSNIQPEPGAWYHVVGTCEMSTGKINCYVNGVPNGKIENEVPFNYFPSQLGRDNAYFTIGANSSSTSSFNSPEFNGAWHGGVAFARIYSSTLSSKQIKVLYDEVNKIPNSMEAELLDLTFKNNSYTTSGLLRSKQSATVGSAPKIQDGVAQFDGKGCYKVDYSTNDNVKLKLQDGHSLEVIFSADKTLENLAPNDEAKMFASHGSGGTGFLITKAADGIEVNGEKHPVLTFLPYVGKNYCYAKSKLTAAELSEGRYYHAVGVWDHKLGKAYIYVNGKLEGTVSASGDLKLPSNGSQWFGIGGDAAAAGVQSAWTGNVAVARIYDDPLTADQVTALYDKAVSQKLVEPQTQK